MRVIRITIYREADGKWSIQTPIPDYPGESVGLESFDERSARITLIVKEPAPEAQP